MVKLLLLVLLLLLEEEDDDVEEEIQVVVECVELLLLGVDNDVLDLKVLLSLLLVNDDDDGDAPSSPQPLVEWKTWLPTVFIAIDHIMMLSLFNDIDVGRWRPCNTKFLR